eukprot:Skav226409  [mRNA]  locus=scaffold3989:276249:284082:- [translate_table: standard]
MERRAQQGRPWWRVFPGGDFAGLTSKLPYIKGLGCRGIWISPVFQNGFNSYHQYAQLDFTRVDQRLGTVEELRHLTSEAHRLGMYVIIDVVMNHMANEFYFEGFAESSAPWRFHENRGEREYELVPRAAEGQLYDTPQGLQPYEDFWYNNTWDPTGTYNGTLYGQYGEWVDDTGAGTYIDSDFHHNGDLDDYFDPWQINYGKIYGVMDDSCFSSRSGHADAGATEFLQSLGTCHAASREEPGEGLQPEPGGLGWLGGWVGGVDSFGIFGEFYVTPARYATMTGRGRDNTMYGQERYIDAPWSKAVYMAL